MRPFHSLVALLACLMTLHAPVAAGPRSKAPLSLDDLYAVYASGDFDVVSREITHPADCPSELPIIKRAIEPWHEDWTRARAVFLLDLAIVCGKQDAISLAPILSAGGTFVVQRPTPVGRFSPDFSFEVTWHLAALGLLQSQQPAVQAHHGPPQLGGPLDPYLEQMGYLHVLEKRFDQAHVPEEMERFSLARGIAIAKRCCTTHIREDTVGASSVARDASTAVDLRARRIAESNEAIKWFERARHVPQTRREASVRGALVFLYRDQPDVAASWLNEVDEDPSDPTLSYWIHAVRGRAYDAVERISDAEREYAEALRVWPPATAVVEWRAVDLLRLHRAAEAVAQTARLARETAALSSAKDAGPDPWLLINRGDERLVPVWRDELRRMIR
jgi:tetratricopeptide (TPR) repeat protein